MTKGKHTPFRMASVNEKAVTTDDGYRIFTPSAEISNLILTAVNSHADLTAEIERLREAAITKAKGGA